MYKHKRIEFYRIFIDFIHLEIGMATILMTGTCQLSEKWNSNHNDEKEAHSITLTFYTKLRASYQPPTILHHLPMNMDGRKNIKHTFLLLFASLCCHFFLFSLVLFHLCPSTHTEFHSSNYMCIYVHSQANTQKHWIKLFFVPLLVLCVGDEWKYSVYRYQHQGNYVVFLTLVFHHVDLLIAYITNTNNI